MLGYFARKIFGSANDRIIKGAQATVDSINALEPKYRSFTDKELAENTQLFKKRISNGESLDHILPEVFATIREASRRVLNMRHFDVQLIGGIMLHRGKIAEMKTGEGKTLVATAPVYLNALSGKGVHVVTVNDYLAKRDSSWMGKLYNFLGLSVACITNSLGDSERKAAYSADITYGTNNEFGFDYLRDNLKYSIDEMVQRPFNYAIVDEVDSILIDEARTPLIISGAVSDNSNLYQKIDQIIQKLQSEDLEIDEKTRSVNFTEQGHHNIEEILKEHSFIDSQSTLYDLENLTIVHHLTQSLKAHKIFKKDVDYIIKDGKVMIIDEFTGRIMDGRRYSEGMHQAIEAKEKVKIQSENQTLASITFQNYFRMYPKLAGMTGTAMTEAGEFSDIYRLEVVEVPTAMKIARKDEDDQIYQTAEEKYNAIIKEIKKAHEAGQPVLVGTVSIEKSEHISKLLKESKITHNILNARYHEQEASIIAQAGQLGAITIATNMAGRGTDIMLGGNAEMLHNADKQKSSLEKIKETIIEDRKKILDLGGLLVIGTERHESRRIDNQLRGRSGRQGDAGRTKFFLSLQDDLMRLFGSEKISGMLTKLGLKKDESIVHPWISKSLEKAQSRVEARNYEIRKNLLKFDDVVNEQRQIIYSQRLEIMNNQNMITNLKDMIENINALIASKYIQIKHHKEQWDILSLEKDLHRIYNIKIELSAFISRDGVDQALIINHINSIIWGRIEDKIENYGSQNLNTGLCSLFLYSLDQLWREHLSALDNLRSGISLRAYGQKDPLNEYKIESFRMFQEMLEELDCIILKRAMQLEISHNLDKSISKNIIEDQSLKTNLRDDHLVESSQVSRNDPCPCNSGKKFKHCHGAI